MCKLPIVLISLFNHRLTELYFAVHEDFCVALAKDKPGQKTCWVYKGLTHTYPKMVSGHVFPACDLCWSKIGNDTQADTSHTIRKQVLSINSIYTHSVNYEPLGKHHSQIIKQSGLQTGSSLSATWYRVSPETADELNPNTAYRYTQTDLTKPWTLTHYECLMCTNKELRA